MILDEIFLLESICCAASAAVSAGTWCVYFFRFLPPFPGSPPVPGSAGGAAATAASFAACVSR